VAATNPLLLNKYPVNTSGMRHVLSVVKHILERCSKDMQLPMSLKLNWFKKIKPVSNTRTETVKDRTLLLLSVDWDERINILSFCNAHIRWTAPTHNTCVLD